MGFTYIHTYIVDLAQQEGLNVSHKVRTQLPLQIIELIAYNKKSKAAPTAVALLGRPKMGSANVWMEIHKF